MAEHRNVPFVATDRMMEAGVRALQAAAPNIDGLPGYVALRAAWEVMLDAHREECAARRKSTITQHQGGGRG